MRERLAPRSGGRGPVPARAEDHRPDRVGRRRHGAADLRPLDDAGGADQHDDSGGAGPDRAAPDGQRRRAREAADRALDPAVRELQAALGDDRLQRRRPALEAVVGDLLRERGLTIAVAESCTGGLLASRLTDVPGSSDYVERGVVCYSNRSKIESLGVPAALIAEHGAVSEPVARAMAEGIRAQPATERRHRHHRHRGPGGGTPEKPVGTVAIAVARRRRRARAHVSVHRRPRAW